MSSDTQEGTLQIRRTRPDEPLARPLIEGLDAEYQRLYGAKVDGEMTARAAEEFVPPRGVMLVLVDGDETIAGGGVAELSGWAAEVKRMWTAPGRRREGHGLTILAALEQEAAALGFTVLRLQTGELQPGAIRLYRAAGYEEIAPFGDYADEPLAIGFEKALAPGSD